MRGSREGTSTQADVRWSAERSSALLELAGALASATTPREVANALSRAGRVATGATAAHLFWRGGAGGFPLVAGAQDGAACADTAHWPFHVRSAVEEADRTGAPAASDACAAVPIIVDGASVGVLAVEHPGAFEREGGGSLPFVAALCAQALHRGMLLRAEREGRRRAEAAEAALERIRKRVALADEVADALGEATTEAQATWVVFDWATERLGATAGVVTGRGGEGELDVLFWSGRPEDVPEPPGRPDPRGPHAEVLRSGRALWLPGAPEVSPRFPALASALRLRRAAWLAVPLWIDPEPCGTLSLTLASAPADDEERAWLQRVVEQCGRAVARARIADAEREARRATGAAEAATHRLGALQRELAAVVAHDLRTPLAAISLCARTLFVDAPPTERQRDRIARICESVDHVARIAGTLRDFAQAHLPSDIPLETERVDVGELVRRTVAEMEGAFPGRTLRATLEGDLAIVGDGGRLLQVLSNLVGNALQHGIAEGPVTVAARGAGTSVEIAVHNEGPPIPPGLQAHLFEPYRQGDASRAEARHTGSMGLGLFIVREIVHAHGGTVSVISAAGSGTTFTIAVPRLPSIGFTARATASASHAEPRDGTLPPPLRGGR